MPVERFWNLIDATLAHAGDQEQQVSALRVRLEELSGPEVAAFEAAFQERMAQSYTWDLWGAAYVINGGCSDDGFEYFRRWLVSAGREVFEKALTDPDSLADLPDLGAQDLEFEDFGALLMEVWADKTGLTYDQLPGQVMLPAEPAGKPFEEDAAHLAARYPKLWKRCGFR